MQKQLIQTYTDIMGRLSELPAAIEQAQIELTAARLDLDRDERAVKDIETQTRGEGKNDEERKADKIAKLKADAVYARWAQSADKGRREAAILTDQVDSLTRQFAAVGYAAKLHGALLSYLAAAGAVSSVGDINFNMGMKANGNGAGHITAADAADLGL
jgi:hypothetical protein